MVFWPGWVAEVVSLRDQWAQWSDQRSGLVMRAHQQTLALTEASSDNLVLVISDGVNHGHLALYGYSRHITPEQSERQRQYANSFGVFE